jgi:predicted transcriptional regulator
MARRRSPTFTDGELRIMHVLWTRGPSTVSDIVAGLDEPRPPAYNTVQTLLRILEEKGHVRHEKAGRAFVFTARTDRTQARRGAIRALLRRFFDDSPGSLVLNVLEHERVTPAELDRVRALLASSNNSR